MRRSTDFHACRHPAWRWGWLLALLIAALMPRAAVAQLGVLRVGNLVWSDTNNNGVKDLNEVGIPGVTVQLWQAGPNGIEEDGGGDDVKVAADAVTDINGNYMFSGLQAGTGYYVRIPTPPAIYPRTSGTPATVNTGIDNTNHGQQVVAGASCRSPVFSLTVGGEPDVPIDGDDTNGDMTIDFGFANPDLSYASNLLDNQSFEFNGAPNTTGIPALVLGYNGSGTSFGTNRNALQWVGNVNGVSPLSTPINNMQVFAVDPTARVSWVESANARNGRRYMLFQGSNSCLDTRVLGGGAWSSKLQAGHTYEWGIWADNASAAAASFLLDMGAADQIITGPHGVNYQYYTATQDKWTGSLPSFAATDYNGWSEATGSTAKPNWRKFTFQFTIAPTATNALIDSLSFVLSGGAGTGPIAMDDLYLAEVRPNTDFGDYPGFPSASNIVSAELFMGTNPTDGELANPTTGNANADDNSGINDEDQVMPVLYAGVPKVYAVPVTRLGSITTARLGVWADWNGDGNVTGPGETMTVNTVVNTGYAYVTLTPPVGSQGTRYIRFRIQSGTADVSFSGTSPLAGEVEDYAITVLPCPGLNVVGPAPYPTGAVGIVYPNQQFTVSGGTGPYTWTMSPQVPGLNISASGLITGTPTLGGVYNVTVTAVDTSNDCSGSASFNITILNCPAEQPFTPGHTYTISVDSGISAAMWFRDAGSGPQPIPGANGLTYTVTQTGTYTWTGVNASGCLVQGCCPISYSSLDYGDYLADAVNSQSAWATIDPNLHMGINPTDADDPVVKPPNALANADDNDGDNDEDLVMPTGVLAGAPITFTVPVLNNTGSNAYISVWIDYNNNNSLEDAGEQVVTSQLVAPQAGMQTLTFVTTVPTTVDLSRSHWVRFRLNSVPNPPSFGQGATGEVEDYLLPIALPTKDYGDYSGFAIASSTVLSTLQMGPTPTDADPIPYLTPNADGDDKHGVNDEDGVTFGTINAGQTGSVVVNLNNTSGAPAYLNAWIDFNNDGLLTGTGEQIAVNILVPTGTVNVNQTITFPVPGIAAGIVGSRFRLTSTQSPGPTGDSGSGEVEDHMCTITCSLVTLNPATVPDAAVNGPYSQTLTASGGAAPYVWALTSGSLPAGMTLNPATGVISGTPTATVTGQTFTVQATDSRACTGTRSYTMNVRSLSIGNLVWADLNPNGVLDSTESGIPNVTMQLWSVGANGVIDYGAGDDTKVMADVVTDINGAYSFVNVPPGRYYVMIPTPPTYFPGVTTPSVTVDNGINNQNKGSQTASGQPVVSPVITLALGAEPPSSADGDGTDGNATIDFGFAEPEPCYRLSGDRFDNLSFEILGTNPAAPNGGTPVAVNGFTSGTTAFGTNVNAYQWVGGVNPSSLLSQPVNRAVVNVTTAGSSLSLVESTKARHGKRYLLMQGANAGISMRPFNGGNWSSMVFAGNEYEIGVYADTASSAASSIQVDVGANSPIIQIISGPSPAFYQDYVAPQSEMTGPVGSFGAGDYTGWSEATGNTSRPNWRKFTYRFRILSTASTTDIDGMHITLGSGAGSGPVVLDYTYLCSTTPSSTLALGGTVWNDLNNDGYQTSNETGIGGVQVTLMGPGPDGIPFTADDVTVAGPVSTGITGKYSFSGLAPGNYYVLLNPPAAYPQTSGTPVNLDNGVMNDNNGIQPAGRGTQIHSPLINLALGQESIADGDGNPDTDLTISIGLWSGFTVGNLVWYDADNNGLRGPVSSEPGISGLAVNLVSATTNTVVASTTTDSNGAYGFQVFATGNYYVNVTPNSSYPIPSAIATASDNGVDNTNTGVQPGLASTPVRSFTFTLAAGKEPGTSGAGNQENTIDFGLRPCPTITIATASPLAGATQYSAYSQTLTASGGTAPYTWTLISGTTPSGLVLNSSGVISGTPDSATGPMTANLTVQARDATGCSVTKNFALSVLCPNISITPSTIASATQYQAYSQTVTAGGGTAPYVYSLTGTLPAGITFNTTTGTLSGTPTGASTPGGYPLTVVAVDRYGCSGSRGYTLTLGCPTITIAPGTVPSATQFQAYAQTLTASGGTGPYVWTVNGTLPAGLAVATATGTTATLGGTPTAIESRTFTVRATDQNGCYADQPLTVAVSCPVITIAPPRPWRLSPSISP